MPVNKWVSDPFYIYISRRLELGNNIPFCKIKFFYNLAFENETKLVKKMAAHSLKHMFLHKCIQTDFHINLCSQCNNMKFLNVVWKRSMDL